MPKREPPYPTEVALCAAFIAALPEEWTAYAETGGWDILLVRNADGFQIGVEAKLRVNVHVINQAIEQHRWHATSPGPDCRAILVPESTHGFGLICDYVGLTIITMRAPSAYERRHRFSPQLPSERAGYASWNDDWHEWCPVKRHPLPEYVPDVAAGSSAPVQLTDWKIRAMKIVITAEKRGYVTREDFRHVGIDHRRWLVPESQWLENRDGVWRLKGGVPQGFRAQHPRVYGEIEADAGKWMRKVFGPETLFGEDIHSLDSAP